MFFCVFSMSHSHGNPIICNIHKKLELCLESKMFKKENEQNCTFSRFFCLTIPRRDLSTQKTKANIEK